MTKRTNEEADGRNMIVCGGKIPNELRSMAETWAVKRMPNGFCIDFDDGPAHVCAHRALEPEIEARGNLSAIERNSY